MEIKILTINENPLLKRKEVTFQVEHDQTGGTPPRIEVKNGLAKILKKDLNLVFIRKFETKTGTRKALGVANIYDSYENAKLIEPEHIVKRNTQPEKTKKEGEE